MATGYFLISGINSFRKQDMVRSQKMMRGRVLGQLGTLVVFMAYAGMEHGDWRLAPMYQDQMAAMKKKRQEEEEEAAAAASAAPGAAPAAAGAATSEK